MTYSPNSDIQHNRNAHAYLLQLKPFIKPALLQALPLLSKTELFMTDEYDEKLAYGNAYCTLLKELEKSYATLDSTSNKIPDDLIFAIYHNDNHILEQADWLISLNKEIRPGKRSLEHIITHRLNEPINTINTKTPQKAESLPNRFYTLFTPNFKPQLETNIPTIKNKSYSNHINVTEYRFATQAQRHKGNVRISPLFQKWLFISAQRTTLEQQINHVYFNNLGIDRDLTDIPGTNEKELSEALYQLEQDATLKIAIITLPASKGLFATDSYKKTKSCYSQQEVFEELFRIARFQVHPKGVVDFKISSHIRQLLFGADETTILSHLLERSFIAMNLSKNQLLSPAQKQAVWLHFNKFELTQYILATLKPSSCNFSCKDAIDRGALSSLYFNLHSSFNSATPMSQQEFETNIDLPAASVKGRGMNFHRLILWNAIEHYVNAHHQELLNDTKKSWLIYWRNMNCPLSRAHQVLGTQLTHYETMLNNLPPTQKHIKKHGMNLLYELKIQHEQKVQGQRLLLEIVSRSAQLLSEQPNKTSITSYRNIAKELHISHPKLLIIAGNMLQFLGFILCLHQLQEYGLTIKNTGIFAASRQKLCEQLLNHSEEEEFKYACH